MTGPRVRWLRKEMGFTQVTLAKRLGIHRVTLADWERGATVVPVMVAELLRCWYREHERRSGGPPPSAVKPVKARRRKR